MASPAGAIDRTLDATSNAGGVQVVVTRSDGGGQIVVGGAAPAATNGGGGPSTCDYDLVQFWGGGSTKADAGAPTPQHHKFMVFCGTRLVGTTWIGPGEPAGPAAQQVIDVAAIAERVVRDIPLGEIDLGVRPSTRGITGIPSLFWVEGYDGRPLERSVNELGVQVDVRVRLDEATWDFGDGAPTQRGLGQPWPARSEVTHTYGTRAADGGTYPVRVELSFSAEYRANGGAWLGLDPIARTATLAYDVNEVQAVRNR